MTHDRKQLLFAAGAAPATQALRSAPRLTVVCRPASGTGARHNEHQRRSGS